jgi:PmbA protein
MSDWDEILDGLSKECASRPGIEIELSAQRTLYDVTKFNEEGIFQNLSERRTRLIARAVSEGRLGEAAAEGPLSEVVPYVTESAIRAAVHSRPVPLGYRFPETTPIPKVKSYFEETARFSPKARAEKIREVADQAVEPGICLSGSYHVSEIERFVVNSSGTRVANTATEADINYVAHSDTSRAHAGQVDRNVSRLDPMGLAQEACRRCMEGRNPREIPSGNYPVILLSEAVADLTPFLGMLVFSALADIEGRSAVSSRIGKQMLSPRIHVWDDGTDPRGLPEPFDTEGVGKRRVELVRAGVPCGFVHDSLTAALSKGTSTGHAFPATTAVYGPIPSNLFIGPGERTLDQMIQEVKNGILISRLHYVRCLDAKSTTVGGVTSDGTFLVQNGEMVYPVKEMRFSESVLSLLARISSVGRELRTLRRMTQGPGPVSIYPSAFSVPALSIESLNLTSTT